MKKILVICLIMLPLAVMAQKKSETVKDFFQTYSELPSYESMEVTEEMFKMFSTSEGADQEMVEFMSKLKFVRYLEYEGAGVVTAGISMSTYPELKPKRSTYYVDGKKVTTSVSTNTTGISTKSSGKAKGQVTNIGPINSISSSVVYIKAMDEIDLEPFTQLMKTNKDGEKMVFLKREWTSEDKEFLMLKGNTLINIRGDLNIMHLYQFEQILEGIGEILEFELPY